MTSSRTGSRRLRRIQGLGLAVLVACGDSGAEPRANADRPLLMVRGAANYPDTVTSVRPDGSGRTIIAAGLGAADAAWSPDARSIAVSANGRIDVMNGSGGNRHTLFSHASIRAGYLDWSPDGRRIAFEACEEIPAPPSSGTSSTFRCTTQVIDATSGAILSSIAEVSRPAWSPDGSRLAVERRNAQTQRNELYTVRGDGTGMQLVQTPEGNAYDPDWSPDGSEIAIAVGSPGSFLSAIWVVPLDGRPPRLIGGCEVAECALPAWDRSGARLAFARAGKVLIAAQAGTPELRLDQAEDVRSLDW